MYDTACVQDVENDFLQTQEKCRAITREALKNQKLSRKLTGILIKPLAPLL